MRVFLSYRREDSEAVVDRVAERLRRQLGPENVFKDLDSISEGENFLDRIQSALTAADVLLAVIGPSWLNASKRPGKRRIDDPDDWVRIEIREALQRDDVRVVPLLVGGATMPGENELPPGLKALAYRNARALRPGRQFEADLDNLAERLAPSIDARVPASRATEVGGEAQVPGAHTPGLRRALVWLTSGIVSAMVLIALYFNGPKVDGPKVDGPKVDDPKVNRSTSPAGNIPVEESNPESLFAAKRESAWRAVAEMIVAAEAAGRVRTAIDPPPILDILVNGRADDLDALKAVTKEQPVVGVSPEVFAAWFTGFAKPVEGITANNVRVMHPSKGLTDYFRGRATELYPMLQAARRTAKKPQ